MAFILRNILLKLVKNGLKMKETQRLAFCPLSTWWWQDPLGLQRSGKIKKSTFYCVEWKYFLSSIKKLWFFKSIIKEWQSHSDYSAKNSKNTWSPSPYIRKINSFSEKKFNIFQENKYLIASGRIWTDISNIYQYWHQEI